jgi:putative DNA primase/helicase
MKINSLSRLIRAARDYTRRGFYVLPIPSGKKHPVLKNWQDLRLTEKDLLRHFRGAAGIGLLLQPSDLADVDCDCPEAVRVASVLLPATPMVHGHRSNPTSHYYFRPMPCPSNRSFVDPRESGKSARATLVELRTNGQTVVPPSRHVPTGEKILWNSEGEPAEINADELLQAVAQVASAALLARYWPVGSRHYATLALAGMLLRAGWSEDATEKFILGVGTAAGDEEIESRSADVTSTAKRLDDTEPTTGTPRLSELLGDDIVSNVREWLGLPDRENEDGSDHPTDWGNARRLVAQHGHDLRYCPQRGQWLVWNGAHWAWAETGEAERFGKATVQSLYAEAAGSIDSKVREKLARHAMRSEAEPRIRAMITLTKTEPEIPIILGQLDADPWLLSCTNGTIDLRTGKLLSHFRENLCTKQVPVAFDPDATCPIWKTFLKRVMNGDRTLIAFVQKTVGYSLTGITREQVLFFLYGTGANGKTTFIETARKLFGDYAQQADFTTFLEKKNDAPRNDLARLNGARFVAAVEAGAGRRLDENVIKQVTGGDIITARYLYHEHFEFAPRFKLFLVANHKPRVEGTDEAIWRRIRLIPFVVTIPKEERDPHLMDKLEKELPGIFAWAVRGCLKWQESGLGEPSAVSEATAGYRQEMDLVGNFIGDCCVVSPKVSLGAGALYNGFESWCKESGEEPISQKSFGTQLRERGFESRKKHGKRCWFGICFDKTE